METWRLGATFSGIALVVTYAIGAGLWVSNNSTWYLGLYRPTWQPPDWVFGLIWPYNFLALGISSIVIARTLSKTLVIIWIVLFAVSVLTALIWSYLFYVPHNLTNAALALITTAILTLPITFLTFKASVNFGLALLPYQLWIVVASSLALGYALKN